MNNVEIIINEPANAYLDCDSNFDIALQYSLADIRDISKRNSAYSKTLSLPGTKNNNFWFGELFDINVDFTAFNPNKKTKCRVLVNTETVIIGFLQLRNIRKIPRQDAEGNLIVYDCVIYNNAVDLMTELGEKTLRDRDLVEKMNEYSHTFNRANVIASWNHTWQDGYVYPMYGLPNATFTSYRLENFYPAPFYKVVLDNILRNAGYGWRGAFKTNPQFENEILPYTGDGKPTITENERVRRLFTANVTNNLLLNTGPMSNQTASGSEWYNLPAPFSEDTPAPGQFLFGDPNNHWDTVNYEWNVDRKGDYTVSYSLDYTMDFFSGTTSTVQWDLQNSYLDPRFRVHHIIEKQIAGTGPWIELDVLNVVAIPGLAGGGAFELPKIFASGFTHSQRIQSLHTTPTISLLAGDKVRLRLKFIKTALGYYSSSGVPTSLQTEVRFGSNNSNWILNGSIPVVLSSGDPIDFETFLPDKLKQKDLIDDLIKRYNLFIEVDPDNPRELIFNTRPDFYSGGKTIDWTDKKDQAGEDKIELLSELQFKNMLFTYKEDNNDLFNKSYLESTGDIYGQYKWTFDNDFVKGEKRIQSQFSPTPLVKTGFGAIVPAIDPQNPIGSPRVLYWGGLKSCQTWQFPVSFTVFNIPIGGYINQYPYAGHFDDPKTPTLDINFGWNKFYLYPDWKVRTNNNMFNTYWYNYVTEIEEGKLLTSRFNLDETDIRFIKDNFNTKIWIKDSYYYVNKIIDYKPLKNRLTTVELIKIRDGVKWQDTTSDGGLGGTACPGDIIIEKQSGKFFWRSKEEGLISKSCCEALGGLFDDDLETCEVIGTVVNPNLIIGDTGVLTPVPPRDLTSVNIGTANNFRGSIGSFTQSEIIGVTTSGPIEPYERENYGVAVGDYNEIFGNNSFIIGNNNKTLDSDTIILGGSENFVKSSGVVLIGADGITASEGNKIYLGSQFNIDTISGDIEWKGTAQISPVIDTSIRLDAADIYDLNTTPIVLIPSPGPDRYIDVISVNSYYHYVSQAFTYSATASTISTIRVFSGALNEFPVIYTFDINTPNDFILGTTSGSFDFTKTGGSGIRTQFDKPLSITSNEGYADGDGVVFIYVTYKIVQPEL